MAQPVASAEVTLPGGAKKTIAPGGREIVFGHTDRQGIYQLRAGTNDVAFCVNVLDAAESNTKPREELQLGKFDTVGDDGNQAGQRGNVALDCGRRAGGLDVRVVVLPSEDRLNWPLLCNSLVVSGAATAAAVTGGALARFGSPAAAGLARDVFWRRRLSRWCCRLSWSPIAGSDCWAKTGLAALAAVEHLFAGRRDLDSRAAELADYVFLCVRRMAAGAGGAIGSGSAPGRRLSPALAAAAAGARRPWCNSAILTFVLTLNNFAVPAILAGQSFSGGSVGAVQHNFRLRSGPGPELAAGAGAVGPGDVLSRRRYLVVVAIQSRDGPGLSAATGRGVASRPGMSPPCSGGFLPGRAAVAIGGQPARRGANSCRPWRRAIPPSRIRSRMRRCRQP